MPIVSERFFDMRRQEPRVLLMSSYLFLVVASYSTAKAVRDSLFVTKIGPAQLPYVYLLIAGAMGLLSLVYSRTVNRLGLRRLIRITSLAATSNLLLFWVFFRDNSPIWFYVLYIWVSLFGVITASQFWLLATHVFNPREARRVFGWIGAGGILGGIIGGGLTNRAAHWFGTESLLICCAVMMAATVVLLELVVKVAKPGDEEGPAAAVAAPGEETKGSEVFRQVRQSKYLTRMILLLTVAVIVEAFIDYEYKSVAKQAIPSKDQLTAFFGSITFYTGIISLLFQVLATNRILKRFGVGWAIVLLPAGLLAAFLALAVYPVLWAAAVLQLVDGIFSYSIHRSGMELLYLPILPETRNAVKGFIDMFVDRAGRAIGAVLLLVFTAGLALSIPALSIIAAIFVVTWIAMAAALKREYLHSFRLALEKKTIEPAASQLCHLDSGTIKTLLGLLSSNDERQVLYALDLLSNTHPDRWHDNINALIQHPSGAVRARTIAVLAAWNDPSIARGAFIHHPDYETARTAAASALRLHWTDSPSQRELLHDLLQDSSPAVTRQAILTAGLVGYSGALPILIEKVADKRVRSGARESILKMGGAVVPELLRRLSDRNEPIEIRKRIPSTLALTADQAAAGALAGMLHSLGYGLDYAVIKALNRMRMNSPGIVFDNASVTLGIAMERSEHDQLRSILHQLGADPVESRIYPLLIRALAERLEQRVERIFLLVGLIYSPHDIHSVYYNCKIRPKLRPSAIEFLDNLLDAQMKELVVTLIEEDTPQQTELISNESAIDSLINGEDPWLRRIANALQADVGEFVHEE